MPADLQENLITRVPVEVSDMWKSRGADAYTAEMATIRSTTPS
jgi:hypothetical protein